MIISKYSGNIVGYLDYYTADNKRVHSVARISRVQRLKRDNYAQDESVSAYVRFCRKQAKLPPIGDASRSLAVGYSFFQPVALYTCKGDFCPAYELGRLVNITV